MSFTEHNEILHTSRQYYCPDVCKILLWLGEYIMNKSAAKIHWVPKYHYSGTGASCSNQNILGELGQHYGCSSFAVYITRSAAALVAYVGSIWWISARKT